MIFFTTTASATKMMPRAAIRDGEKRERERERDPSTMGNQECISGYNSWDI